MLEDCKNDFKEHEVAANLVDKSIQGNSSDINSLSSQLSSAIQSSESHIQDIATNMLSNSTNSLLDQSMQSMLNSSNLNESKHDMPLTFSNLNVITTESSDKIWSLIDSANNDEFANQSYMDNLNNPNVFPFSDQSLLQKAQSHSTQPPQIKRAITGASGNYNHHSPQTNTASTRNQLQNSAMYNSKNAAALNWHTNPQTATSMSSNLTWSNSFNSTLPSCLNTFASTSTSNSIQNAWSNNACNNVNNSSKRPPIGSPSINASKKSIYSSDHNQSALAVNSVLSPSKFRRNPAISTFKNFANNNLTGQSNLYDLGSAGSDNTSSSSDSANLRDNGQLHLQERNVDSQFNPLETLRYSLEPQLLEIVRNNVTQDSKPFNFPYQGVPQDDKKHIKGRNFSRRRGKSPFFTGSDSDNLLADFPPSNNEHVERFSRKVFVGGLPPDIDEEEITASFRRFGSLVVDWPHKAESKSYFPPKGYAFLLFQEETSVQMLIDVCIAEEDKLYLCVSSPTIKDKPVQIRPWRLSDADYVLDASMPLDPRKTVFVGGVPRPLKAVELAMIMDRLYGGVCYAGIDTDPELKYPKGAGRVAFSNQQSYIAAISARFVQLQHADIEKRVEVKPYVLDDQICDECQGTRCGGKFAPYFCANITCLQYYCENCWATIHSRPGREFHKPLVKEGADRPRAVPFRWC